MYGAMKRHEIQVLRRAGVPIRKIAELAGVSRSTIKRIAREPEIEAVDDGKLTAKHGVGRPSKTEQFRDFAGDLLEAEPDLPTVELLHRARLAGYEGGKSAFYELVSELRAKATSPMVRFEGLPGEFSQHDFGEVDVCYLDGSQERIRFFASRLKYSRWSEVRLVPDERVEALVRSLLGSFESWGGVPLVAVFDNPKTVVLGRKQSKIEWNRTFGQVALDYRFAPELCTPRRANEKGSVENLVGWVKGSFFKVRRFHDREDLEQQLADWHREVNHERPSRATGVIPAERMADERPRLRRLAIPPADYPLRFPIMVGPTGKVRHDGNSYSMPPESIGFTGTLYLYLDRVRIVAGRHEAVHERDTDSKREYFLPGHRAAMLATVSGQRAKLYFKRQQLLELGVDAESLLTEIVHRHPRTWRGEVEILFDLLQSFGELRLYEAVQAAVERKLYGAHYVASILERGVA
jgi:transposase